MMQLSFLKIGFYSGYWPNYLNLDDISLDLLRIRHLTLENMFRNIFVPKIEGLLKIHVVLGQECF